MAQKRLWIALLLGVVLLTLPVFFDIYRTSVFNAAPHDDYASYVLHLAGRGGQLPGAPMVYRVGSVAVALPFFYTLPTYTFSNLQGVSPDYVRATEAVSAVSYLSLVLTSIVIAAIVRKRYGGSWASAVILALLSFFLSGYTAQVGIDPLAILIIAVLVYWLEQPGIFIPLILGSTAFNEKIPMIFAVLFSARLAAALVSRRAFANYAQLVASWLAVIAYFAVKFVLAIPGYEYMTDPRMFLSNVWYSTWISFTPKGVMVNLIPIAIVGVLVVLALRSPRRAPYFQTSDASGALGLLAIALLANLGQTVGRIAMYCYPLYLPVISTLLDDVLRRADESRREGAAE